MKKTHHELTHYEMISIKSYEHKLSSDLYIPEISLHALRSHSQILSETVSDVGEMTYSYSCS